jgi:hypothetical protein
MKRRHSVLALWHYGGPKRPEVFTVWCGAGDLELTDLTRQQAEAWLAKHEAEHPEQAA